MTKPIINLDDVAFDVTGQRGEPGLRKIFRTENTVDYYDREPT